MAKKEKERGKNMEANGGGGFFSVIFGSVAIGWGSETMLGVPEQEGIRWAGKYILKLRHTREIFLNQGIDSPLFSML